MDSKQLADRIAKILDDKKAREVTLLDIAQLTVIADYFVVCSAQSTQQVRALCDELEEKLKADGIMPLRVDGYRESRWVVMDFAHVIVHIFHTQEREFYNIERLWTDGQNLSRLSDTQQ